MHLLFLTINLLYVTFLKHGCFTLKCGQVSCALIIRTDCVFALKLRNAHIDPFVLQSD